MLDIDNTIPIPTYRRASLKPVNLAMLEAMNQMEVGSSFLVDEDRRSVSVFLTKRGKTMGKKFTTVVEDGKTRVWRVA